MRGVDFLIIDPEDEYRAVCAAVDGQHIRLASSSPHRLNPFDLPPRGNPEDADGQDPLAERVTALHSLLAVMLTIGGGEPTGCSRASGAGSSAVPDLRARGISADPSSHQRSAPLLRDLHETLMNMEGDVAVSLAARLEPFVYGSLSAGLFAGPTNVQLDGRLVVFSIQQLAEELRPLAIQLIAGHVWNRARRIRRPRLLVVDEAWSLLRYPEGGAFLASMARRARKYWLGLVTISQLVADFVDDPDGTAVFQNAQMKLLLKQDSDGIARATEVLKLSEDERRLLLGGAKGEGLLFARGTRLHITIQASQAEHRLATTTPSELAAMAGASSGCGRTGSGRELEMTVPRSETRYDVDEIKLRYPLADVVAASGVDLKRGPRGKFWALCPFHPERTPSFLIDTQDNHFHCFGGCQRDNRHGDVITYVMRREGVSFADACARLTGAPPPARATAGPARAIACARSTLGPIDPRRQLVLNAATTLYREAFWRAPAARAYVRSRGIPDWVVRDCGLGYADGRSLEPYLRQHGGLRIAEDLGLLRRPEPGEGGRPLREFFAGRVVVPELRGGQPIWLIGRAMTMSVGRESSTWRCPGSGRCWASSGLPGAAKPFLIEGVFDWLTAVRLASAGLLYLRYGPARDRLGWLAGARVVYGVLDGDAAGRAGAARFAEALGPRWRPSPSGRKRPQRPGPPSGRAGGVLPAPRGGAVRPGVCGLDGELPLATSRTPMSADEPTRR